MEEQEEKKPKHINKFEWGFVLGVLVLIDVIQFVVEWFDIVAGVGVVINRVISILAGLLMASYYLLLKIRGATIDMRAWMSVFFAVLGELIPIISAFPLFSMDIAYVWSLNSKSALAEATNVAMNAGLKGGTKSPVMRGYTGGPGGSATTVMENGRAVTKETTSASDRRRNARSAQSGDLSNKAAEMEKVKGAIPPKIPDGRQPLPRRIPQEPGVGEP